MRKRWLALENLKGRADDAQPFHRADAESAAPSRPRSCHSLGLKIAMSYDRFNRWQGMAATQLSVAVSLLSGLSISALAFGFSLLQGKDFSPCGVFKSLFTWSLPLLLIAAVASTLVVVSRLLDFRLTARKLRKQQVPSYSRSLTIFRLGPEGYGRLTWFFFWLSCGSFILGVSFLFVSIWVTYVGRL